MSTTDFEQTFDPKVNRRLSCLKTKNCNIRKFWRSSWILAEKKIENISETVRDRAILSKLLAQRVVKGYPMQKGKFSIFATFGGHLRF